jgi:hypothetical protein
MALKYNYPHTFFLSVGIAIFLFGLSIFYINNYIFSSIEIGKLITHILAVVLGTVCIFRGLKLWGEKEEEKKELAKISREKLQLELEDFKNRKKIEQLRQEIKDIESSKGKSKEEIEEKNKQLKKLSEEIKQKQLEKEKVTENIYSLKQQEVSKIPDNYFLPVTFGASSMVPSLSGGALVDTAFYKTLYGDGSSSGIINTGSPLPTFIHKKCSRCSMISLVSTTTETCPCCGIGSLEK